MRHKPLSYPLMAGICVALIGCGGGGGGQAGNAASDDWTVLQTAGQKWDGIDKTDLGAATDQMIEWLRAQPQIAEAGLTDGLIVWAELKDGTLAGWCSDRWRDGTRAASAPAVVPREADRGRSVPRGKTAYLFHSDLFGLDPLRAADDVRPQLRSMLESAGYAVVAKKGTLDDYKQIDPAQVGLLWTNTHGNPFPVTPGPVRQFKLFMGSSTTVGQYDHKPGSRYYDDLQQKRLLSLKLDNEPYFYWFSSDWLKDNVSFGQSGDSLWINNACYGSRASDMSDAAFAKGLSAYIGWDDSVIAGAANLASLYLVDRMAGTNKEAPVPDPSQRPFDLPAVYTDMASRSPKLTESNVVIPWIFKYIKPELKDRHSIFATLRIAANSAGGTGGDEGFTSLAPSIGYMTVTAGADSQTFLDLYGVFGDRQALVTIGGVSLTVTANGWTPSHVRCILPAPDQAGAYGDVVVTVDGHQSNPVPLTMWEITLTQSEVISWSGKYEYARIGDLILYEAPSGSRTVNTTSKIFVRADVHTYRAVPGKNPLPAQEQPFTISTGGRPTRDAIVESLAVSGSATIVHTDNKNGPVSTFTNAFSTAGSAKAPLDGSDPRADITNIYGRIYPATKELGLVYEVILHNAVNVAITADPPDAGSVSLSGPDADVNFSSPRFTLDDDFNIVAGSKDQTDNVPARGTSIVWHTTWTGRVFNSPSQKTARSVIPPAMSSRSRR